MLFPLFVFKIPRNVDNLHIYLCLDVLVTIYMNCVSAVILYWSSNQLAAGFVYTS